HAGPAGGHAPKISLTGSGESGQEYIMGDTEAAHPGGKTATTNGTNSDTKLRLLLVNPTIADKPEHVHIGLGTVGTYVKQHSAHEVRILHFMACRGTWRERLRHVLDEYRPDLVGMYISSPYFPAARTVAQEIKRLAPRVPVLAGGHHATLSPDATMAEPAF